MVDSNQQRVVGVSEEGIFASQLDIGYEYKVFWPHQIACFEAAHTHAPLGQDTLPAADVYVAEYLGKHLNYIYLIALRCQSKRIFPLFCFVRFDRASVAHGVGTRPKHRDLPYEVYTNKQDSYA